MAHARQMLDAYPRDFGLDAALLAECIEACFDCAQACTACADACLAEKMVGDLVQCIRLNLDCADVSATTGRVMSRQIEYDADLSRTVVEACRQACASCADECEEHAGMHGHCRVCAEACRRCEQACERLLAAMA